MEKGQSSEAVDGEIYLHEAIIHHIQSFLSCKEAAQTSILCKSWYNAWATRPVVDLDQLYFQNRWAGRFFEYWRKIMRRYEESNLKIEVLRLCMRHIKSDCISIVEELIVYAMKLGVSDLNFEVRGGVADFYLPHEVLRSENLVRLSLHGCSIDLGRKVGFSKLKSLTLSCVYIEGIPGSDIVSYCRLIEELVLSMCNCICIEEMKSNDRFRRYNGDTSVHPYGSLKSLYLEWIQIGDLFVKNKYESLPCLKNLTFSHCWDFDGLQISSSSLEFLSIVHTGVWSAKFDVPRLRKFTFSENTSFTTIPGLSFEATSREWESHIFITNDEDYISSYWLTLLKNFLMKLSLSKISLYIRFNHFGSRTVKVFPLVGHVPSLRIPEVENLMLSIRSRIPVCSSFLKCLFWACRPKLITHGLLPEFCDRYEENSGMLSLLRKTLTKKGINGYCIPKKHMFDKYGLKKVDVEAFIDSLAEWRPLSWEALRDASKISKKKQKIRFKLGWRQNPSAHLDEIL